MDKKMAEAHEQFGGDPVAVLDCITLDPERTNATIGALTKIVENSRRKYAEERFHEWYYAQMEG